MKKYQELITSYYPITAAPFQRNKLYTELAPCPALHPYIRCFWGTTDIVTCDKSTSPKESLVIPDTCMDIIIRFDHVHDEAKSIFCSIDENSYVSSQMFESEYDSVFAIRFYAWTAALFVDDSLLNSKNQTFEAEQYFTDLQKKLVPLLIHSNTLSKRAEIATSYLLKRLKPEHVNHPFMNAVYDIIHTRGTIKTAVLAEKNVISKRHLERIFNDHMGTSPKSFSSLIRYQMLWQDLCRTKHHDILDLADKYGYYDQAHLLNDFKKYHSLTPTQAIAFARE